MVKWSKVEGLGQKGWFAASALMLALSMIVSTSNVLETFAAPLKAQVPEQIGFEGYLTDPNNATLPLDDGAYAIRFSVFNAATAGTELWAEVQPSVAITGGYFSTTLGSITPFTTTTIFDGDRWIAVRLTEETGERSPRTRVLATPFAFLAENVPWTGVDGVPAGFADGQDADTQYSAGAGLTLSGTEFRVVTSTVQSRVTGTCAVGQYVRAIAADGTVTCGTDANSTYTAGTGLTLVGAQFQIVPTIYQRRLTQSCSGESSIKEIKEDGTVTCEIDTDTVGVTGNGIANYVTGWTGGSTIGNSGLTYSGSTLNVGGGLNLGSATGAGTGSLKLSGSISASTPIAARVERTVSYTVASGIAVVIPFNAERSGEDPLGMHDNTSYPSRITVPVSGVYLLSCGVRFDPNTVASLRSVNLFVNGAEVGAGNINALANQAVHVDTTTAAFMNAGQYAECSAYQNSGASAYVTVSGYRSIEFVVARLP